MSASYFCHMWEIFIIFFPLRLSFLRVWLHFYKHDPRFWMVLSLWIGASPFTLNCRSLSRHNFVFECWSMQYWRPILGERLQNLSMFWLTKKTNYVQWKLEETAGDLGLDFHVLYFSVNTCSRRYLNLFWMQWSWERAWTSVGEAEKPVKESRNQQQISDACWGCSRGCTGKLLYSVFLCLVSILDYFSTTPNSTEYDLTLALGL